MSTPSKVYASKKDSKRNYVTRIRSSINNRKPQTAYAIEKDDEFVSSSAKKLKLSKEVYNVSVEENFAYRIVCLFSVLNTISTLVQCKACGGDVHFTESSARGLGFKIVVNCENCEKKTINSCPIIKNAYEINRRIIFAMRLLGIGLNGVIKFCAFMDLPRPIFKSFYDAIIKSVAVATSAVRDISIRKTGIQEKELSIEKDQKKGVTVSGDGSWRKRGFSSLYGIVSLIGWHTGKVLDVTVKSKFCKICESWASKEGTTEYDEWKLNHADQCQVNHEGSSAKMEVDGATEMFARSEELHGIRYSSYIGDGDSKTFKGIVESHPYSNLTVTKKECIDHVQKRMGTRLREVKKKTKGLGGRGKLTEKLIDKLTIFYGLAIRRNVDSVVNMRKEIWATLKHNISTNDKPQHDDCPAGSESWCSWQRAKADNDLANHNHNPTMDIKVYEAIKPIYDDLSRNDLLQRCLGGYTQNTNECFNKVVWTIAPKNSFGGKLLLDVAVDIATMTFNDGLMSLAKVLEVMGVKIGPNCYTFCAESDATRITKHSMTDKAKDARRANLAATRAKNEAYLDVEGQLYGAGIAD